MAAVEALAASEPWFTFSRWEISEFRFSALGEIVAHAYRYPIRLVYPDPFPSVPAWVEPQDPHARWSQHQYGTGGTLCLELRPDNWSTAATGADVLRSAYNLLVYENPLGEGEKERAPSAHHIGEIQSYDWRRNPVLIGAGCLERIRAGQADAVTALRWMAMDDVWPIYISDATDRLSARKPPSIDVGTWRFDIPVVILRAEPPLITPVDRAALTALIDGQVDATALLPSGPALAIVAGQDQVVAYHTPDDGQAFQRNWVTVPDEIGARSGRSQAAAGKRIAIVGAGSVGSKLAEIVLRAGIERLVLVDGDVFLPGNLERHVLDWRDVGFRKVHALKRRLLHIAPGADISVIDQNLNWQRSAKVHADQIETIAACEIIVDAAGDPATTLMLGAVSRENGRAFVSVEVFEGGLGALVARSVPGIDPSYIDGRAAFSAWCDASESAPPASGRHAYEALNEAGELVVADDAAVSIAASHTARIVLDIADDVPGDHANAWLLLGFRAGWIFTGHGHAINLKVGAPAPALEGTEDAEAAAFAGALAKEAVHATTTSS